MDFIYLDGCWELLSISIKVEHGTTSQSFGISTYVCFVKIRKEEAIMELSALKRRHVEQFRI
jgi:hypothetical protein